MVIQLMFQISWILSIPKVESMMNKSTTANKINSNYNLLQSNVSDNNTQNYNSLGPALIISDLMASNTTSSPPNNNSNFTTPSPPPRTSNQCLQKDPPPPLSSSSESDHIRTEIIIPSQPQKQTKILHKTPKPSILTTIRNENDDNKSESATYSDSNNFENGRGYKLVYWTQWSQMSKNSFCCYGRIMFGVDFKNFIGTNVLILTPSILEWLYVFPYILLHFQQSYASLSLCTMSCLLFICCFVSLYFASFTDPGYLPRGNEPIPAPHHQLKANGAKFCETCKIWRPPRAKHCRFCNQCVRKFDHHWFVLCCVYMCDSV